MGILHDENGHQGVECTKAIVQESFYCGTMLHDIPS